MDQTILLINTLMSGLSLIGTIGVIYYLARRNTSPIEKETVNAVRFEGQPEPEPEPEPTEKEIIESMEETRSLSNADKILKCLDGKPKMPAQIAEETGIKRAYVSGYLTKLMQRKLVKRNTKGWVKIHAKQS